MELNFLPPLFEMDDYKSCMENSNNLYCNIDAKLNFDSQNTTLMKFMENAHKNKLTFDRTIIHRALCLPKYQSQYTDSFYSYSSRIITKKIKDFNLSATVNDITCIQHETELSNYDLVILWILMIYISLILFATYYGMVKKNTIRHFLWNISLINTWNQRTTVPLNTDYQKLTSMQGLRFFALMSLFYTHVMCMYNLSYISNPTEYEKMFVGIGVQTFATLSLFIVSIFFLISQWLLTIQVYNIYNIHGELSLKHVGIMILNRYFRLAVTVAFGVILLRTSLFRRLVGPTNFSMIVLNENACKNNWIQAIFFLNNFDYLSEICNPVSWYLSADFQVYVINLLLLYLKLKFKIKSVKFYSLVMLSSCILHGILLYAYEVDIMFKPYIRNLELKYFKNSDIYSLTYMSTISIWPSSFVGVIMGAIYHNTKNNLYTKTRILNMFWSLSFFGLPILAALICQIRTNRIFAAILGTFIKPIYTLGIGIGIWGLSHNFGGIIKKILENKNIVLMSNFIFCIYLIHTGIINTIHSYDFKPLDISDYLIVTVDEIILTTLTTKLNIATHVNLLSKSKFSGSEKSYLSTKQTLVATQINYLSNLDPDSSIMLPPLYELDDYSSCIKNENQYCKVHAILEVPFGNTKLLKYINDIYLNTAKFDRSVIYRGLCMSSINESHNQSIQTQLSNILNRKLTSYNLTTKVDYHVCSNGKSSITLFDNIFLYSIITYLIFVLFATYYVLKYGGNKASSSGIGTFLSHFSLVRSWKNRTQILKNEESEKLLSMQGLRFLTMTMIIQNHVLLNYFFIYTVNPETFEKFLDTRTIKPFLYLGFFIVLNFFVMSSWLSTLQAYNVYKKYGKLSIKHVGIIIINRYFRFVVSLLVAIMCSTNWMQNFGGPLNIDLLHFAQESCNKNWIYNVFYLNNFLLILNSCNVVSWYLASDFQLYLINLLIIYLIFKFKLNEFKTYGIVLLVCCSMHGIILYYYNINIIYRPVLRNMEQRNLVYSSNFIHSYTSTLSILSSSCVGMIMGAIYFKNRIKIVQGIQLQIFSVLWFFLFIGLPILAVLIAMEKYGRNEAAILGSIVKPVYCLGIGIGILGMSHNIGGIIKRCFENKYIAILGNFSFSIYICHMMIVTQKHRNVPPHVDYLTMVTDMIVVYLSAIILGIIVTLVLEEPLLSLQKTILPQIKKSDGRTTDESNYTMTKKL